MNGVDQGQNAAPTGGQLLQMSPAGIVLLIADGERCGRVFVRVYRQNTPREEAKSQEKSGYVSDICMEGSFHGGVLSAMK
jgi:hypothetical protein